MKQLTLCAFSFILLSNIAAATEYKINTQQSTVSFAGKHAGNDFSGQFEDWNAEITFDKNALQDSKIKATFNLESAKTGNKMFDGTLPQTDWFNTKKTPQGHFTSTNITASSAPNTYEITGDLALRNQTRPITFTFTLDETDTALTRAAASFDINRLDYNIGLESDPDAEWVSKSITINLDIAAQPIIAE